MAKNPITQCAPQFKSCAPLELSFHDHSAAGSCVLMKVMKMFFVQHIIAAFFLCFFRNLIQCSALSIIQFSEADLLSVYSL